MALPSIGGGSQIGDGNQNEAKLAIQPAPITVTSAVTFTPAQIAVSGLFAATPGSALNYTLPTAVDLDALLVNAGINSSFEFTVINLSGANIATIATATGWTLVGAMAIAVSTTGQFRARKTAAGAWTLYRVS